MSLLTRLSNLVAGPPHISDGGDDAAEVDDDLDEEMPDAAEDVGSLVRAEGGRERLRSAEVKFRPDIGPFEDAEHAHEDTAARGTPPGPNP